MLTPIYWLEIFLLNFMEKFSKKNVLQRICLQLHYLIKLIRSFLPTTSWKNQWFEYTLDKLIAKLFIFHTHTLNSRYISNYSNNNKELHIKKQVNVYANLTRNKKNTRQYSALTRLIHKSVPLMSPKLYDRRLNVWENHNRMCRSGRDRQ